MCGCKKMLMLLLMFPVLSNASDSLIDSQHYRPLFSDRRALLVGDILTVVVLESTTAESSAATGESNEFSIEGRMFDTLGDHRAGAGLGGAADGEGQTSRRGVVKSQLSVRVTEVLPNDLLRILGEQSLTVNGETQKVLISGLVRVVDISRDNAIISNRIAEAKIEIAGDGDVSDAQRQSIIYKVFKWLHLI